MKHKYTLKQKEENWVATRWRPACAWTYLVICIFDFIIFPVLWSLLQAFKSGQITAPWQPLTLQGAGLMHMSFGAIVGVTAWSRGNEKQTFLAAQVSSSNSVPPAQQNNI